MYLRTYVHVCTIHVGSASAHSSTQPATSTFSAVWPGVIFPAQTSKTTREETTQVLCGSHYCTLV